jgi:hypothetical protein
MMPEPLRVIGTYALLDRVANRVSCALDDLDVGRVESLVDHRLQHSSEIPHSALLGLIAERQASERSVVLPSVKQVEKNHRFVVSHAHGNVSTGAGGVHVQIMA